MTLTKWHLLVVYNRAVTWHGTRVPLSLVPFGTTLRRGDSVPIYNYKRCRDEGTDSATRLLNYMSFLSYLQT